MGLYSPHGSQSPQIWPDFPLAKLIMLPTTWDLCFKNEQILLAVPDWNESPETALLHLYGWYMPPHENPKTWWEFKSRRIPNNKEIISYLDCVPKYRLVEEPPWNNVVVSLKWSNWHNLNATYIEKYSEPHLIEWLWTLKLICDIVQRALNVPLLCGHQDWSGTKSPWLEVNCSNETVIKDLEAQ